MFTRWLCGTEESAFGERKRRFSNHSRAWDQDSPTVESPKHCWPAWDCHWQTRCHWVQKGQRCVEYCLVFKIHYVVCFYAVLIVWLSLINHWLVQLWSCWGWFQESQAARYRQHCVNGDWPSQWRWRILTHHRIKTHEPTATQLRTIDYVRERTP